MVRKGVRRLEGSDGWRIMYVIVVDRDGELGYVWIGIGEGEGKGRGGEYVVGMRDEG